MHRSSMRTSVYLVTLLAAALAAPAPAPAPAPGPEPRPAAVDDQTPEIIEIIAPAASAQETLSTLNLGAPGSELSERNKRTIGILRQLFPTLTQIIEQKVQQLTSMVLQTLGPVVLRAFLGGGRGGAAGGGKAGGGGGTVELDDDDDDDDDDDEPLTSAPSSASPAAAYTNTVSVSVSAGAGDSTAPADAEDAESRTAPAEAETEATSSAPERRRRRKRALFFLPNAGAVEENQLLSGAESQNAEVRVAFEGQSPADQQGAASEDQQTAEQGSIDEISLDDVDGSEENRNKRFLSFGAEGGAGGGGGSGNFLFDIVRGAPAAMARAAGNAFRVFAGTDSLSLGLTASHTAARDPTQLVAGSSSGSQAGGEGAEEGEGAAKGDNLTEGVPGPVTRLFIIANRGIANLIQDLILRIAQTSERIVNFKARLITSII